MSFDFAETYTRVTRVVDRSQLQCAAVNFASRLGFKTISAMGVRDRVGQEPIFEDVHNTPVAYLPLYEQLECSKIDPVLQHCKRSALPIAWGQSTYVNAGRAARWETQAAFGYRVGIAFALHLPRGLHFMVGVDRDEDLPACVHELSRMAADLQMFAVHAHDVAMKVLLDVPAASSELAMLTDRELESLRWTMEGKTAWEVGRILSISEHTVVKHLNNATRKLECVNKHHAVVKALRLGLMH